MDFELLSKVPGQVTTAGASSTLVCIPITQEVSMDKDEAAELLLRKYLGRNPSLGEVERLAKRIAAAIVDEFKVDPARVA